MSRGEIASACQSGAQAAEEGGVFFRGRSPDGSSPVFAHRRAPSVPFIGFMGAVYAHDSGNDAGEMSRFVPAPTAFAFIPRPRRPHGFRTSRFCGALPLSKPTSLHSSDSYFRVQ